MKQPFPTTITIIAACQAILTRFLIPGGLNEAECIKELLAILDGPEAVLLTEEMRLGQKPNPDLVKLKEAFARYKAATEFFKEILNETPTAAAVNMSSPPPPMSEAAMDRFDLTAVSAQIAARANRLQEELERVRKHETHLIQERDRLIHGDIANLNQRVTELTADRDAERSARYRFSEHLSKAEAELMASQERERRLSERLASIAALVSDM